MENLKILSKEKLVLLMEQTQVALDELKNELDRRESNIQEREISNLDNHMKSAELSLSSIKNFIDYLRSH